MLGGLLRVLGGAARAVQAGAGAVRGAKTEVKVSWVRPPALPAYHPDKSGDLEPCPKIPSSAIALPYQRADELKDASEQVRRLCSVGMVGGGAAAELVRHAHVERVRRHAADINSIEIKIARMTGRIRNLQEHLARFERDVRARRTAQEQAARRKQLLKFVRRYDYRKFEWLLATLGLQYKQYPESAHKLTRREALRRLTELQCSQLVQARLDAHRTLLRAQQGPFLRDKLRALQHIRAEQHHLQLPLTVTQQDIDKVEAALRAWTEQERALHAATATSGARRHRL